MPRSPRHDPWRSTAPSAPGPTPRALAWRRLIIVVVGIAYGIGLWTVLLWPVHVDGEGGLIRVDGIIDFLARMGMPAAIRYPLVQSGLNAVLFLPFGALWASWFRRQRLHLVISATLLASAASLAAEIVQGRYLPERTFDLRDVVANGIGAGIGALIVVLAARSARPTSSPNRPTR
ncbi:VanZ family protein [Agromyces sp. SYSU T00266]|uniref:VanZ family protein n=1 Tax=Agromyces zhanjiangensis TaxID=3158562 RepID=UPI003396B6E4